MYTEGIVIKQFFRWAKKRKLILENPIEDCKLRKPKLVPKFGLSLGQIDTVLAGTGGKLRAMIALLAFTGMRSGELQRLRKEDVDLTGNWIHVVSRPGAETKTRSSRKIPIHARLREILIALPRPFGPLLFTAEPSAKYPAGDHEINTKRLNESFKALLKKLNLPLGREDGFTIHSFAIPSRPFASMRAFPSASSTPGKATVPINRWRRFITDSRTLIRNPS